MLLATDIPGMRCKFWCRCSRQERQYFFLFLLQHQQDMDRISKANCSLDSTPQNWMAPTCAHTMRYCSMCSFGDPFSM